MAAYLQFQVGLQTYAVPVDAVIEVLHLTDITPIPDQPEDHLGVMTLRGRVIPVIDLSMRYNRQPVNLSINTPMIALQSGDKAAALVVDTVHDVLEIAAAPETSPEPNIEGVIRFEDKMIILPYVRTLVERT